MIATYLKSSLLSRPQMRIRTTTHIGIAIAILVIGLFDTTAVEAASITAPTDYVIPQGTVGSVPISVTTDATPDIVGVDVIIQYDSSVIEVFSSGATSVTTSGYETDGWFLERNVVFSSGDTKEIRISAASTGTALPVSATSTLFAINFQAAAATSPTSSPLAMTLADLNETTVTATSGSVKLGGVTGVLTVTPDPVKPSRYVDISLTDTDNSGAGTASVTINSRGTSGGTINETQPISLTEVGATGVFTGGFSTTYGTSSVSGGAFEVAPGDVLDGQYTDAFDASGDAGSSTDEITVAAGTDGTVVTSRASVTIGSNLTVTGTDANLNDAGAPDAPVQVTVVRFNASGMTVVDSETVTVSSSGVGVTILTSGSAGSSGDGTLNVQAGDQLVASYDDETSSTGAAVAGILSITTTDGSFTVPSDIEVTEDLVFSMTDTDIEDGSVISGNAPVL